MRPFLFASLLSLAVTAAAQSPILDSSVRQGVLPNGVHYLIRPSGSPVHQIELGLVARVGSLQEAPEERGLAHLVEHLGFEGTRRFQAQEIVQFSQSIGMKFGDGLNAHTSYTDTCYFLDLPDDRADILAQGMGFLADWATGPRVTPEGLAKQLAIVTEEARLRTENVQGRLSAFLIRNHFYGSPYADRSPIGEPTLLAQLTVADVQRFVDRWYRPSAMTVVATGSINPDTLEALIQKEFGALPAEAKPQPLPSIPRVGAFHGRESDRFEDPGLSANSLVWNKVIPVDNTDPTAVGRFLYQATVLTSALNNRIKGLVQKPDAPFRQGSVTATWGGPGFGVVQFQVVVNDQDPRRSVTEFLAIVDQAAQGITEAEYKLVRDKRQSPGFGLGSSNRDVTLSLENALAGFSGPILSYEDARTLRITLEDSIDLQTLNRQLASWLSLDQTRMLILSRTNNVLPSAEEVNHWVDQRKMAVTQAPFPVKPLYREPPTPGTIDLSSNPPGSPFRVWTLSNGLRVYFFPNDLGGKDEVLIRGVAPGGLSLADDADLLTASYSAALFSATGAGDLGAEEVARFLAGHRVSLELRADGLSSRIEGASAAADVELLFQWLHARLTGPRRDAVAERARLNRLADDWATHLELPETAYRAAQASLEDPSQRSRFPKAEQIRAINPDRAAEWYQTLFGAGTPYTFVVTGSAPPETLRSLVETYLATLPEASDRSMLERGEKPVAGPRTEVVHQGHDQKAVVTISIPWTGKATTEDRLTAEVLQDFLHRRMREVVREDNGGTYGIDATISPPTGPRRGFTRVQFTCAPERWSELASAATQELKSLVQGSWPAPLFSQVRAARQTILEKSRNTNGWWTSVTTNGLLRSDNLALLYRSAKVEGELDQGTAEALARQLWDPNRAWTVVLLPED